jgi:hypothetical protein
MGDVITEREERYSAMTQEDSAPICEKTHKSEKKKEMKGILRKEKDYRRHEKGSSFSYKTAIVKNIFLFF